MSDLATLSHGGRYRELEARTQELLIAFPSSGLLWKILGVAQWTLGKNALASMQKAAELLPNDAEARCNLANTLRADGQLSQALESHRRTLELFPDYAEAHNNCGSVLQDLGRLREAAASFRRATSLKPDFALAYSNLGSVLSLLNQTDECEANCRRALELNPNLTSAIVHLAEVHAGRGQFDTATELLRRAISIEPDMPEAWAGLARWKKMTSADADWLIAAQRIAGRRLAPPREIPLRYALGKYFDDLEEYDQAFVNYARANELAKVGRPMHDRERFRHGMGRIIQTFDGNWLSQVSAAANPAVRPVLVIGMPRSGTTLAEQILASHADVFGAGELPFWNEAAVRYATAREGQDDLPTLTRLGGEYLALLDTLSCEAGRVVDKMPANFLYLGLINATLPNAKIIHMRRHPVDTCLSIYFQNFDAKHAYANDLDDLAHYYREYLRVMDHWRDILPSNSMLEVSYEGLVDDTEGWSRRMVEFIGLPWDANCLEFHLTERTVDTSSKWQARQRITRSSVERWRPYEKFVGPLKGLVDERELLCSRQQFEEI